MKLSTAACTHVGRRANNEDSLISDSGLGLFAVADGMGGYEGGEVASRMAVETLREFIRRNHTDDNVTWPYALDRERSLAENMAAVAARLAHERIARHRCGPLASMGSTLAMMLVPRNDQAIIAHIGDSRIYRLRNGVLEALTIDHSLYEELVRSGMNNLPPRREFPHGNVITRALGVSGDADVRTIELVPGDVYLLCTDGLTEVVSENQIAQVLAVEPVTSACTTLVNAAYEGQGRDNITCVVVRCDP